MLHRTTSGCCEREIGSSKVHIPQVCDHGEVLKYTKGLGVNGRKPLPRVSKKREGQVGRQGSTLWRGRGFAVHPAQRAKVKGKVCVGCGDEFDWEKAEQGVDPAHLWPRSLGGCDHPDCVIPLCRACHDRLDDPSDAFDLLPQLVNQGYHREIAHAIEVHETGLTPLLERLTGVKWAPVESPERSGVGV